jgi:hypothetical protein
MDRPAAPGPAPLCTASPRALPGRPLVHDGRLVVASVRAGDGWIDELSPEVNPLDELTRRALADQWLDDALAEHASIAAFTRVAAQLLALGGPPELLEGAHRAALDEVRHARVCFTLASMYGAAWKAPDVIDIRAVREARCDLAAVAREALVEGCLGEGTAAALARQAAARCADPEVKRCLEGIADDESRHEELAWSIVGWCLARASDAVAEALAQALRAMPAAVPLFELPAGVDRAAWVAAGRCLPAEAAAAHATVAARVAARAWAHPQMAPQVAASRRAAPRPRR